MAKRLLLMSTVLSLAITAVHARERPTYQSSPAAPPSTASDGAQTAAAAAPVRIEPNARVFLEPTDFGRALAAAILKKKVPVIATTDRSKADFFVQTASSASEEKTAERLTKVLVLGAFAGTGRRFDATVTVTDRDGAIVFAHNCQRENFQSAAESVAKELRKHVEGK